MPLVKVNDLLRHATENHYGVAAVNVCNYETIKWVAEAAGRERIPVIIQFYPGFEKYIALKHVAAIAKAPEEERPALVAELRKPQKKKKAEKETAELPAPVKIDNQQLLEIAASRYHAKQLATGSDMLCEIEAAADSLKERWEQTFQYYPDLFTDPDNRAAVRKIVRDLMNYLKRMEERTE